MHQMLQSYLGDQKGAQQGIEPGTSAMQTEGRGCPNQLDHGLLPTTKAMFEGGEMHARTGQQLGANSVHRARRISRGDAALGSPGKPKWGGGPHGETMPFLALPALFHAFAWFCAPPARSAR